MMTRISEVIRGWLGWCPHVWDPARQLPILNNTPADASHGQGKGIPARTSPMRQYRDQLFLWAIFFTMVSLPLIAIFIAADLTRFILGLGTITGFVVFLFFGRWLWHSLGMLGKGVTIKTGQKEYILTFIIAGAIPLSVVLLISAMLFLIPLAGALAFPAFATGFAFIPWYVFIMVLWWEEKTGSRVMFDKETSSFTAVRGPADVHR